jgi:hypothetical protein
MSGFEGMDAFRAAIAQMNVKVGLAAQANVRDASAMVVREAMGNFVGSHKKNKPHIRNGPPDRPNIVTGNLRRSIRSSGITSLGGARFEATAGPTAIYGRRVELGYHDRGAYPFFGPAVKAVRPRMQAVATSNWAKYLT